MEKAPALPADQQKPLMDAAKEGERVLHWLENALQPEGLWNLLMPVALSAAASCFAAGKSRDLGGYQLRNWLGAHMTPENLSDV